MKNILKRPESLIEEELSGLSYEKGRSVVSRVM